MRIDGITQLETEIYYKFYKFGADFFAALREFLREAAFFKTGENRGNFQARGRDFSNAEKS